LLRPFIVIGLLSGGTGALAEPVALVDDALKTTISGSTVELDTPLGTKLPIRFGTDGLVAAEAGDLAPILGSAKDRGRWWVEGEKLCSKWFRWFDAEIRCITVSQDGPRLYWRKDDGETGTATLVERAVPDQVPAKPPAQVAVVDQAVAAKAKPAETTQPVSAPADVTPRPIDAADPAPRAAQDTTFSTAAEADLPRTASEAAAVAVAAAEPAKAPDETAQKEEPGGEKPMMMFGGAGLLEASSRVGAITQSPPAKATTAEAPKPQPQKGPAPAKTAALAQLPPAGGDTRAPRVPSPTRKLAMAVQEKKPGGGEAPRAFATGSVAPVTSYRVWGVETGDVLNVRRGPSEVHPQIAGIPPTGRRVEITGRCQADWCPIRYGKIKGWVNSYYLVEDGQRVGSSSPVYVAKP